MNDPKLQGLTAAQVQERIRQGQVNRTRRTRWRDYGQIVARNLLTWYNAMVTPAAIALWILDEYQGAIAVSGMAIVNSAIGLFQEIRAKHHLDKLTIMVEAKARVVRDGQVQQIPSGDAVLGDCILLSAGETVVADGPVLTAHFLEIDEALLTGESDPVRQRPGDQLLSGSYCVAGEGAYRADKVGSEAFAQATSAEARSYKYTASPLTHIVNRLVQILSFTAFGLFLLYLAAYLADVLTTRDFVRMAAATITSMVPQGMVLTATLAMLLGAVYMSRRGAVVQRLAAVETMASIDAICTDKTGTLTTNRLQLDKLHVVDPKRDEETVRQRVRQFVSASMDQNNKNIQALRAALGETRVEVVDELPFKSQNRYSAVRIRDGDTERVLVLGACEALQPVLSKTADDGWQATWKDLLPTGLRLLLFTEAQKPNGPFPQFTGSLQGFTLEPLALVALSDELRREASDVLEALAAQGIAFKVISGDNPETVRATVAHLKLPLARDPVITGDELMKSPNKDELISQRSVFGRVSPHQKVEIVEALRHAGFRVAMIGDGVNDVLPIKRADLGIAMGEGSQAAKTVSGLVLENNNFALLPETLEEGRTIIRNLRRSAKLFLVKNVYSLILILACFTGLFGPLHFPYRPQQVTLLNWLVIGLPALVITFSRERSKAATRPRFLLEVGWFAVRSGVVFALTGLAMLLISLALWPELREWPRHGAQVQRTMLLSLLVLLGITALFRALRDAEPQPLIGDTRFRLLGIVAIPTYLVAMYLPAGSWFFELEPLGVGEWGLVLVMATVGYASSLWTDRWRLVHGSERRGSSPPAGRPG